MSTMSIGGLASGLDTTSIIAQLMALERGPRNLLDTKQTLLQTKQTLLKGIQTQLRTLQTAAADLRSVTLFSQTQRIESSDPTKVSASSTSGAGVGGYQLEVTQLANAAQRSYAYTAPAADGSITIDGHATAVRAGMSAQELATAINTDRDATVYAAATADDRIVLSTRATGATGGSFINVTADPALTEDVTRARDGRDALYTVDGVASRSSTNVLRDAVAGVTLTLRGVTTTSGPITISVGAPGADTDAIQRKVQAFVDTYNATVDAIRSKLDEKSVPDPRTQEDIKNGVADPRTSAQLQAGTLFADTQLNSLLSTMRQAIYSPVSGAPAGFDSLSALGISTGAVTATTSKDTLAGKLTLDVDRFTKALTDDPNAVRNLLSGVDNVGGWARSFESIVNTTAGTDGILASRITGGDSEITALRSQMSQMDQRLSVKQRALEAQFAALEVAMSKSQTQSQWLTGQLAGLNNN
ncbi:flagellar filament capping protein FliD [Conexibacter sp. CPCC 206217]|uniref:flagellar filament capping protein FliD n=1 Tax=Conexibacter sp. CPCC 206217 TaxID=3064574 RepID=UPI00271A69B8|nr:flagellar filament capping protein FliD [Conexibacter sp. CPCC 206217]MDO8211426.1 flagellar filament capping protein FliD [Conexibacter sp. CPCC 206217]